MPIFSSTPSSQYNAAALGLQNLSVDNPISNANPALKSLSQNAQAILTYYSQAHTSNSFVSFSFDELIQKLLQHNLVNPSRNNTWEFPHTGGVIAHECGVQVLANILSDKTLALFSNSQQKNILSNLDAVNSLQKIYIMYHDIGKMHPVLNNAVDEKHQVKANNKDIEKACTLMCIFMTQVEENQELLTQFNSFIDQYKEAALTTNPNPAIKESLAKDLSKFEQSLNVKVEQSNASQYQKGLFHILTKCLCPDDIGTQAVISFIKAPSEDKLPALTDARQLLLSRYTEYKQICTSSKIEPMHQDAFMFLKASNFIADIAYYINLRSMYFDKHFDFNPNLELIFLKLFNPEYTDTSIDKNNHNINYSIGVSPDEEVKVPAMRPVWSVGGKLHNLSMCVSLAMMQVLSKAGFDTANQEEEIRAFSQEFTQDNYKALQGGDNLLEVIKAQNQFLLKRIAVLKGNSEEKEILPNLTDFASKNIFSLVSRASI